ncbi:MAG: outer membrane beta-barrel protein [Candidatus Zixiibacteriota bacterium]|nr:MAG: outer membrane beta-barrel protein [candidate division Zixibacteria bacterium]
MKKSLILLSALLILLLNSVALAQDEEEEWEKDVLELNFYGGIDMPTGVMLEWQDTLGAETGYNFGIDIGYFVSIPFVTGFGFRFSEYEVHNRETDLAAEGLKHRVYNPCLYAKYFLMPTANLTPYVKASAGLTFLKFTTWVTNPNGDRYRQISYDPAFSFGLGGGLFYYTSDYGGFFAEGNYHYVNSASVEAEYEGGAYLFGEDLSSWEIHAGIRILVGSGE